MLNTLAIVKKMTAAGMPVAQAEVFAQTLTETTAEHLATKRDIKELSDATKRDIKELGDTTKRDIKELGDTTKRDLQALRLETKRDIKDLEVAVVHQMKEQLSSIERAMERMQFQMLRAGMAIGLGVVGILGGLMRYLGK